MDGTKDKKKMKVKAGVDRKRTSGLEERRVEKMKFTGEIETKRKTG